MKDTPELKKLFLSFYKGYGTRYSALGKSGAEFYHLNKWLKDPQFKKEYNDIKISAKSDKCIIKQIKP
jgi:hypothetical protein